MRGLLTSAGIVGLLVAGLASPTRGEERIPEPVKDRTREQKKDGSCLEEPADVEDVAARPALDQDRLQKRDQLRDRLKDGTCDDCAGKANAACAHESLRLQTRQMDRLSTRSRVGTPTSGGAGVEARNGARAGMPEVELPELPALPEPAGGAARSALDASLERTSMALRNAGEASEIMLRHTRRAMRGTGLVTPTRPATAQGPGGGR